MKSMLFDTWNKSIKSMENVIGTLTLKCGNNDGRSCGLFWIIEKKGEMTDDDKCSDRRITGTSDKKN